MSEHVYLAGPITGLTFDEGQDWRQEFVQMLAMAGFQGRSPLRGKSYLRDIGRIEKQYAGMHPLSENAGIVTRDRNDVTTAAVVILNLLGAQRVSIGTMVELGWADAARVPTIVIMEDEGNVHDHAFVRQLAGYVVPDAQTALEICVTILGADLDLVAIDGGL